MKTIRQHLLFCLAVISLAACEKKSALETEETSIPPEIEALIKNAQTGYELPDADLPSLTLKYKKYLQQNYMLDSINRVNKRGRYIVEKVSEKKNRYGKRVTLQYFSVSALVERNIKKVKKDYLYEESVKEAKTEVIIDHPWGMFVYKAPGKYTGINYVVTINDSENNYITSFSDRLYDDDYFYVDKPLTFPCYVELRDDGGQQYTFKVDYR